jgi:hypothetical protein
MGVSGIEFISLDYTCGAASRDAGSKGKNLVPAGM